jgi:hypothetical protein
MKKILLLMYLAYTLGFAYCLGQTDKILHYNISQAINGAVSSACMYKSPTKPFRAMLIGSGVSLGLGTVKELVWDGLMHRGVMSFKDEWANISGNACYNLVFTFYIVERRKPFNP